MNDRSEVIENLTRDLRQLWEALLDGNRYQIPETREDFLKLGLFPYFRIGDMPVYASDEVQRVVLRCAEGIRSALGQNLYSLSTIADTVREEVKRHFSGQTKSLPDHVTSIVDAVALHDRRRLFLRVLHGLEMRGIAEIVYGSWRIVGITDEHVGEFANRDVGDHSWKESVRDFLKAGFVGRTCILVEARGDRPQARANAAEIARFVVDALRYFASIHLTGTGRAHDIGLRLGESKRPPWIDTFEQTLEEHKSAILGRDERTRRPYPINQENLTTLRADWGAERLWSLIERAGRTDLEQAIVTALTWFGDAQNEEDIQVSYVKYWTALEALVTAHSRGGVSARLKKAIPVMLQNTPGAAVSQTEVKDAYDLRSRVVHGSGRPLATWRDRNLVNEWAWRCIACSLRLLEKGYSNRKQIEEHTARFDLTRRKAEQRGSRAQ